MHRSSSSKGKVEIKKISEAPEYASQIPYVPVNWVDRDALTRRVCDILEAVMPEGNQLEKTKDLVKEMTKQYWINLFNDQFDSLTPHALTGFTYERQLYSEALWEVAQGQVPTASTESINQ